MPDSKSRPPKPADQQDNQTAANAPPQEKRLPQARHRERPRANATPAPKPAAEPEPFEVGYRKPPRHSQFQPGRSGNPKGRPRGAKSMETLVDEALSKLVPVKLAGRSVKMSQREALVYQMVARAQQGDHKAFLTLMKLDPRAHQTEAEREKQAESATVTPEEQAALLAFLQRYETSDAEGDL